MHGLIRATHRRRQRASARRHFRYGWRAAAARAFTGAELYLNKTIPSLAVAAVRCGSNVHYVRAAIVLIQDKTRPLLRESVLAGHVSLLAAASQARQLQKLARVSVEDMVATWRSWSPEQRAKFGRSVGVAEVWDHAIVPVITEERASQQAAE
jgi:hypothetical protein